MQKTYIQNIIARILKASKVDPEKAEKFIDDISSDPDLLTQAERIVRDYLKPENRDALFSVISVPVQSFNAFIDVCSRDSIGVIMITNKQPLVFSENEKVDVLFLSTQENVIKNRLVEAEAISGTLDQLVLSVAETCIKKDPSNPLYRIKSIDPSVFEKMKENIKRLPPELRFTLFPNEDENDDLLNVSFFTKTYPMEYKSFSDDTKRGPYSIPKIISVMLACALLERPELEKNYSKIMEENKRIMNVITDLYFDGKPLWLIPGRITNKGLFESLSDNEYKLDEMDEESFNDLINSSFTGINDLLLPLTKDELELFDVSGRKAPLKSFSFVKENEINKAYHDPAKYKELDAKESLIDMLNRKREQLLCLSDDFNGNNLEMLDHYIYGSISEMIIREDEEWHKYLGENEVLDAKEAVLNKLKEYSIEAVDKDNNKVNQMIKEAKDQITTEKEQEKAEKLRAHSKGRDYDEELEMEY